MRSGGRIVGLLLYLAIGFASLKSFLPQSFVGPASAPSVGNLHATTQEKQDARVVSMQDAFDPTEKDPEIGGVAIDPSLVLIVFFIGGFAVLLCCFNAESGSGGTLRA
mmetsp:Transcript_27768/g.54532  ORF Transcript_27768/g.54532 Transcript_27768/m.54532 type:complete len:108 (-) Transcript_27768:62-385(-)